MIFFHVKDDPIKEVIRRARDLISDPNRWTRGATARMALAGPGFDRKAVSPTNPQAEKWCAWGAIIKCAHDLDGDELANKVRNEVEATNSGLSLTYLNDSWGHARVLRALDKALSA